MENDIKIHGYDAEAKGPAALPPASGWAALERRANELYDHICAGTIEVEAAEKEISKLAIEACREQANQWREARAIRDAYKPGDYDAD